MRKLTLLICLLFGLSVSASAEKIVLVADAWPPYNNPAEDSDKGYIVDIAEAIFAKHGHDIVYKLMPWKVAIEEARKGTYDGLIGADTEDGAGFIFPTEEAGSYQVAFFVKKGNPWRFTNTNSLKRIKLGVAEGYGYTPWLYDYIHANKKDVNRVQTASGENPLATNINKLMADRLDVTTASTTTMHYTAMQMGVYDQIQFAGSGGPGRDVYVVFSPARKSSQAYADLFDEGVRELRASGKLEEILSHYGLTDWK